MKRLIGTLLILVLLIGAGGGTALYIYSRTPMGTAYQEIHIARGTPLTQILQTLEEAGVISNATWFRLYLLAQGISHRVRAGDYEFRPGMTPREISHALLAGDFKVYRFTIPEGWTLVQIANYLERQGLSNAQTFLTRVNDPALISSLGLDTDSLEGYVYPSTYETYYPTSPDPLIEMMLAKFHSLFTDEWRRRAQQIGLTLHEVVTLASIVEKETGRANERPLIASVFHNRLRRNIPLQSDPTTIYGIKNFNGNLTRRHLETYTPYNTYVIAGLPPGPIASPGQASLLAVLYPAESNYLYFVSKNDGSHAFAETLAEHNRNVKRYQLGQQP